MEMTGEYRIPAPRDKVWQALNDPAVLQTCIPGCESLEKISDTEMTAAVRMRVGPVSARFSGKVTLSDIDPPNGYTITGEGQGGAAGFAKGGAKVALREDAADTVLTYTADAQVGGKLAQIGSRLIDGTARKLADEFFAKFAETLGGGAAAPGDGGAGAAPIGTIPAASAQPVGMPMSAGPVHFEPQSRVQSGPMSAAEAAAHNARASADSAARGMRHWLVIGAGIIVLVIVWLAVR